MTERNQPQPPLLDPAFLRLLERLSFLLRGRIRGSRKGERRSNRRGQGSEFADHRAYTLGDDLRHLDWHLFARLDSLFVRLYEEEKEHTVNIVIDTSASMACGKELYVKQVAAALAYIALCGTDRVGLFAIGERLDATLGPLRGKSNVHRVLSFLSDLEFGGPTHLERAVSEVAKATRRGTLVLLSDFLVPDGRLEALRTLASRRYRTLVLHVLTDEERMPTLGQDLTLVDSESGAQLTVTVDRQTRQAYLAELALLIAELKQSARGYGFTFVDVTTSTPLADLVLSDLRKLGAVASAG